MNCPILFRKFKSAEVEIGKEFRQFVVPKACRESVLTVAHDSPLSGHLGTKKTAERVTSNFYWPGIQRAVKLFLRLVRYLPENGIERFGD